MLENIRDPITVNGVNITITPQFKEKFKCFKKYTERENLHDTTSDNFGILDFL